jgi:hypothetical protein
MDMVEAPQDIRSKHDRVFGLPSSIDHINEVIHQRCDPEMLRRTMRAHLHLTRTIFASICVQTCYGVIVDGLHDVLRKKGPPHLK